MHGQLQETGTLVRGHFRHREPFQKVHHIRWASNQNAGAAIPASWGSRHFRDTPGVSGFRGYLGTARGFWANDWGEGALDMLCPLTQL